MLGHGGIAAQRPAWAPGELPAFLSSCLSWCPINRHPVPSSAAPLLDPGSPQRQDSISALLPAEGWGPSRLSHLQWALHSGR